jgi:hypothetical protein
MITIEDFPNFQLVYSAGIISETFLVSGIKDFHEACHWVRLLPYGPNSDESDSSILFEEGHGTCTAKHGVIARLASEHGKDIARVVGFYRLNEDIIPGVTKIFERENLPFVPQVHCFLQHKTNCIDLTEGNCTGKKSLPTKYDIIVRVPPDMTQSQEEELYDWGLIYYFKFFPALRKVGKKRIFEVLEECKTLWRCCLFNESN